MAQANVEVPPGYKFAVLAVSRARGGGSAWNPLDLGDGFAVSSSLPTSALESWRTEIGSLHEQELRGTHLFLWVLRASDQSHVLDRENHELRDACLLLYISLLIATPYFSSGRLTLLTGGNLNGETSVRSMTTYRGTEYTLGAPLPSLTTSKLRLAADLARALTSHDLHPAHQRIDRSVRAFREACESKQLDQRLHQFVRCAEAFAMPPWKGSGKEFAKRLGRLCAKRAKPYLEELYTIRSGIEHLHGPFDRLPTYLSRAAKHVRVLQRCVQAEALARFLLTYYLTNSALWNWYRDRASIDSMWGLTERPFRRLWPKRILLAATLRAFDHAEVLKQLPGRP